MKNVPDSAFIQEYVGRHKTFRKYAYRGTPDIRVIVFNKIPVMAELRLPTKESNGKANLHQGAIGVGVDIATGITTADVELISVNPNPAKDVVYLNAASIRGTEIAISITSVDGRVVYSSNTVAEEKILINLQNLNAGIYFINVNGKEFKQMTKLIKE